MANEVKKLIDDMLSAKVIEKARSAWSFPVVLVTKPDGSFRFCVNYSKLTEMSIKDSYPLPRIDDTFDHLQKAKLFSTVDAASGFWQAL